MILGQQDAQRLGLGEPGLGSLGRRRARRGLAPDRLQSASAFIRASKSSDWRTGLVRQAEICKSAADAPCRRAGRRRSAAAAGLPAISRLAADLLRPGRARPSRASCRRSARRETAGPAPRQIAARPAPRGRPVDRGRAAAPVRQDFVRGSAGWWRCRRRSGPASPSSSGRSGSTRHDEAASGLHAQLDREPEGAALARLALDPDRAAHQLDQLGTRSSGPAPCRRTAGSSSRRPARTARRSSPASRRGCRSRCRRPRSGASTARSLDFLRTDTATTTSPRSVNLIALPTRLTSTWRSRPESPIRASGTSGAIRQASSRPLACARSARVCKVSSSASRRPNGASVEAQLAGLDLGEVEDVVDDRQQRLGRALDQAEVLALAWCQARCPGPARSCR